MLTPKIILYKHKTYADGQHPIILQVVKNGKPIRKVIGKCFAKDWLASKSRVSPKNIEAPRINNNIELALKNYGLSKSHSFEGLFTEHIDNFKTRQQVSRYEINKLVLRQILEFAPGVEFQDINERFINKFAAHLSTFNKPGTIKEKMNVFGALMKIAKKKKLIEENPFEEITFPKVKSTKSKLNVDEIRKLAEVNLKGEKDIARDIFLASIYLRGARVGDVVVLKEKNIIDGRLNFTEMKTGRQINIGIRPELAQIFEKWKGKSRNGYLFDLLPEPQGKDTFRFKGLVKKEIAKINRLIKVVASEAGIEKSISTHTARHSFSRLANATIKDTTITKDLIGHATLAVHEGYISEISDDTIMDEYAGKVLDQLKKSDPKPNADL